MGVRNPTACYRELGAELVRIRKAARIPGEVVARRTGWSRTKVARIEHGKQDVTVTDVVHYIVVCGARLPDEADVVELAGLAERKQDYWLSDKLINNSLRSLIYHESAASSSISYEPLLVPGLLHTPAYAEAQVRRESGVSDAEVRAAIRTRMERQRILQWSDPARFVFFVHEQALRLRVGSPAIMQEQLLHLVLMTALNHVTLRVIPAATGEKSAFGGPFQFLEFGKHPPLVYLDHFNGGLFLEDRRYVENYQGLLPELTGVALDEGESRSFAAALADEYDRGSQSDAAHHLEDEHV
jgi:transcriptional regulator with XRE-family HTH domain